MKLKIPNVKLLIVFLVISAVVRNRSRGVKPSVSKLQQRSYGRDSTSFAVTFLGHFRGYYAGKSNISS